MWRDYRRVVQSSDLVHTVRKAVREEPVLVVPQLDPLLEDISSYNQFDLSEFDKDTRYQVEAGGLETKPLEYLSLIFARRYIAGIGFDKLIPREVWYSKTDAAFAYRRAAKASYWAFCSTQDEERLPWRVREVLGNVQSAAVHHRERNPQETYYSFMSALEGVAYLMDEVDGKNADEEFLPRWTLERLRKLGRHTLSTVSGLVEVVSAIRTIPPHHASVRERLLAVVGNQPSPEG